MNRSFKGSAEVMSLLIAPRMITPGRLLRPSTLMSSGALEPDVADEVRSR